MKVKYTAIAFLAILVILILTVIATSSFTLANGQQPEKPLPVLLIHGYASDASVWETWEQLLRNDNITFRAVTFDNDPRTLVNEDKCGTAVDHASELNQIVEDFKRDTGAEKINVVAHSKGGLDARVYLANDLSNNDVENLIMIGTPNLGSPLAIGSLTVPPIVYPYYINFICAPAVYDLIPGSAATQEVNNENTRYYTIAGSWIPDPYINFIYPFFDTDCSNLLWLPLQRWANIVLFWWEADDGIVPMWSAAPQGQGFVNIGITDNCHTNLFSGEEYKEAKEVLLR
jgi:pimeloyl-ACP methyl ester carboxylesterase